MNSELYTPGLDDAAAAAGLPVPGGPALLRAVPHGEDLHGGQAPGRRDVPVVLGARLHVAQLPRLLHLHHGGFKTVNNIKRNYARACS